MRSVADVKRAVYRQVVIPHMTSQSTGPSTSPIAIGGSIPRQEDPPFLTGEARYTDDLHLSRLVYMAVVRSQRANAPINHIDVQNAENLENILAVFTGNDIIESQAPGIVPARRSVPNSSDPNSPITVARNLAVPDQPLLATETAKYVGEPLAVIVGTDRYSVHDAVNAVDVEYGSSTPVLDPVDAVDADPIHDSLRDNIAFEWVNGNEQLTDQAFNDAPHTVRVEMGNQRVLPVTMEPRAAVAEYQRSTDQLTVWRPTQGPQRHKQYYSDVLGPPPNRIQVLTPKVGGAFGTKSKPYPEELLTGWCAMQLNRPVKWQVTRSESAVSDAHGRGHVTSGELAFDTNGLIHGLRATSYADMGAYVCGPSPSIHTSSFTSVLSGQYAIPAIHCRIIGTYTNTSPVSSYRATSRPPALVLIERLIDLAAQRLDIDPREVRERNFIQPDAFPYQTPISHVYDSGEYQTALNRALDLIQYDQYRSKQAVLRDENRYLGIGIACALDSAGGSRIESARIRFHSSGKVTFSAGTLDSGQGHQTTFAQLLVDKLGIPFDDIAVHEGDSDDIAQGSGTSGSRTAVVIDNLVSACTTKLVEKGTKIAAYQLEAPERDVEFEDGDFYIRGAPDRSLSIQEIAKLAHNFNELPPGMEPGFEVTTTIMGETTYPFGTHVAVVEVFPESGEVEIEKYVAVDDCGVQINPPIVEGQIQGAVGQGLGEVLFEGTVYDDNGNLLNGSLSDYAVPNATQIPELRVESTVTPSPLTDHGVKGIAEGGTAAAPAVIVNAVMDALRPFGIDYIDTPLTPERIWHSVRKVQ